MFGSLGFPEIVFILLLALLIFGPRKLPEVGRSLGRMMGELRRASNEFKRTINTELELDEDAPAIERRPGVDRRPPARPSPTPRAAVRALPATETPSAAPASTAEAEPAPAETSTADVASETAPSPSQPS